MNLSELEKALIAKGTKELQDKLALNLKALVDTLEEVCEVSIPNRGNYFLADDLTEIKKYFAEILTVQHSHLVDSGHRGSGYVRIFGNAKVTLPEFLRRSILKKESTKLLDVVTGLEELKEYVEEHTHE